MTPPVTPEFGSIQKAKAWMLALLEGEGKTGIENERVSYLSDEAGMAVYEEQRAKGGGGGSFDRYVMIDGRRALVGCNFLH